MAHAHKTNFAFRRNGRIHLNPRGRQFSRLLAAEVFVSAVVMLDTPCSEVVWRVLATHSIHQFPPSLPFPCVTVCRHISTRHYQCYSLYLKWRSPRYMSWGQNGDVGLQLCLFLTSALDGGGWSSSRSGQFTPGKGRRISNVQEAG